MATTDDYLKSPKWVEKLKQNFTILDRNKNGYLSQEDYMAWVETLKKVLNPDPQNVERLREGYVKLAAALGAGPGAQLTQEQYLKATAEFVANCNEERRKLLDDLWEATYVVMDTNKDGKISLEEYTKVCVANNQTAEVAEFVFKAIDKNHNGTVELKELIASHERFLFDRGDNQFEGLSVS